MNKWIVEATGKLEKLIDKELEVDMGEKKFKFGDKVAVDAGVGKIKTGIGKIKTGIVAKSNEGYVFVFFDGGECSWYSKESVVLEKPSQLSGEELAKSFVAYCNSRVCEEVQGARLCELRDICRKKVSYDWKLENYDRIVKTIVDFKAQKEQEKKEEGSWKCSNPICDSKEVGKSKHFCKKCGCLLVKPIAKGELERDRTVKIEMKFCEEVYSALVDLELAPPKEVLLVKQD